MTKLISRKVEFQGWRKLETVVVQPKSLKHDGYAEPMSREVLHCGTVAAALLYQPETDEVLLNQQFRIGAFLAGDKQPALLEVCAGYMDENESPETAIRREAVEETGCRIIDLEFICKAYPSPGSSDEIFMIYCGRISNAEAGDFGLEEEGEEIKTHLMPAMEAIRLLDTGQITNGATVIALNWFARHHDRLREKWRR